MVSFTNITRFNLQQEDEIFKSEIKTDSQSAAFPHTESDISVQDAIVFNYSHIFAMLPLHTEAQWKPMSNKDSPALKGKA